MLNIGGNTTRAQPSQSGKLPLEEDLSRRATQELFCVVAIGTVGKLNSANLHGRKELPNDTFLDFQPSNFKLSSLPDAMDLTHRGAPSSSS